jgi:hypothetical protein
LVCASATGAAKNKPPTKAAAQQIELRQNIIKLVGDFQ